MYLTQASQCVLINYASTEFKVSQRLNSLTGMHLGGFDSVIQYGPVDLPKAFRKRHAGILHFPRGGGYWIWKPYIISRTLSVLSQGDRLFYSDSGAVFIGPVKPILELATERNPVVCFSTGFPEYKYSKRDAFLLLDCDRPGFSETPQRLATFIMMVNCKRTRDFFLEFLRFAGDPRIVTDQPNTLGLPDYPGFIENRHDQTVFSLLSKKAGFACYRNPSRGPEVVSSGVEPSLYPQLLHCTRARHYPIGGMLGPMRGLQSKLRHWIWSKRVKWKGASYKT